jgi:dCTP diphosphatase
MTDVAATVQQLRDMVAQFVTERDWNQFHNPKNLSMNIAVEAGELMEFFIWVDTKTSFQTLQKNQQEVENELADILISVICFANASKIDLAASFAKKLAAIAEKYPIEKVKGKSDKYTVYTSTF